MLWAPRSRDAVGSVDHGYKPKNESSAVHVRLSNREREREREVYRVSGATLVEHRRFREGGPQYRGTDPTPRVRRNDELLRFSESTPKGASLSREKEREARVGRARARVKISISRVKV